MTTVDIQSQPNRAAKEKQRDEVYSKFCEMSPSGTLERSPERRVKVYELTNDGQWAEEGVGYVALFYFEKQESYHIVVRSEETDQMVLNCKVRKEDQYQPQQGAFGDVDCGEPESLVD